MRKKPAMPLIRGADIVRSTLEADTREVSETDYAVSQSSDSDTDEERRKEDVGYESSTLPFQ